MYSWFTELTTDTLGFVTPGTMKKISKSEKETHTHKIHHCVWDGVGEASVIRKLESVMRTTGCMKWRKWMSHEPNNPRKTT